MYIDGTKYYFRLGDKNYIILRLKKFLNQYSFVKIKNNLTDTFDKTLQAALSDYQTFRKLKQQDGSLNAEVYSELGSNMTSAEIDQIALRDPVLKKLLYGIGLMPMRVKTANNIPILLKDNVTPIHPNPGKVRILPSNGNTADEAVDKKLAMLFGDEKQKTIVNGANQAGRNKGSDHYLLDNGMVYTIHIFGETGNEFIDVYLPKEFEKPFLSSNANPKDNGMYGVVSINKKTGAVLSFAHLDSIYSQVELNKAWNTKITNSVGSRYIGTIGVSGGVPGYMHSHIMYFVSLKARDESRAKK